MKTAPSPDTPPDDWLGVLNPEQRRAATFGDGPLLVVAGAGSGKTRTLAYRVAWLIQEGVAPERILLLTFTRRAAQEMLRRAGAAMRASEAVTSRVWGGTFHAIANRLVRMHAQAAGLSPDFTILDQSDAADVMHVLRHELGLSSKGLRFPRKNTCLSIYSRRVSGCDELKTVLERFFPWCKRFEEDLNRLFQAYVARKQEQQVLDYDDLLLYWYFLLEDQGMAQRLGGRFDYILVDEYQDTNRIQAGILERMRTTNPNLMVVGDDAQSIYSFRAATVENMLAFPERFADCTVVKLEQNYRSTPAILASTNRLIEAAEGRFSKELWSTRTGGEKPHLVTCRDEVEQDGAVIERILAHYEEGIPLREQAVLFRAASHSSSLELELTRKNIPFVKYGGLRFLEAAHIKDLINLLRILENPSDQMAWFRILQLLEGVGPATAARAFTHVRAAGGRPSALAAFKAPPAARAGMASLALLFHDFEEKPPPTPAAELEQLTLFYTPLLEKNYDHAEQRRNDLVHLTQLAERHRKRSTFLSELILDPPASTADLAGPPERDEDWVVLSTIHSAKGCEWDVVYLIHAADGFLPSDMATDDAAAVEEERRLAYVAMTRARDFLYVTWPLRYYHRKHALGDGHTYAQLSRFFTPAVLETMAGSAEAPPSPEAAPDETGPAQGPDIAARLRDMWS